MRPLGITIIFLSVVGVEARSVAAPVPSSAAAPATSGSTPTEPDVRVNDASRAGRYPNCVAQMGASLAALGPDVYVAYNDLTDCPDSLQLQASPRNYLGFARSSDFGRTFVDMGPLIPGGEIWSLNGGDDAIPHPVLAVDSSGQDRGRIYVASEALVEKADGNTEHTLAVGISSDRGATFTWHNAAPVGTNRENDPWIAADNSGKARDGSVYLVWSHGDFGLCSVCKVMFSRSTDGGASWSKPEQLSANQDVTGPRVAVGPDGEVHVVWEQGESQSSPAIYGVVSVDGGTSFSQPAPVAVLGKTGHLGSCDGDPRQAETQVLDGDIRTNEFPSLAVDTFGSADPSSPAYNPARGTVYVVFAGRGSREGDESDVFLTRLVPGEQVWSQPARVNDDQTSADQFFPEVVVPGPGRVTVSWTDRRSDGDNLSMEQWVVTSADVGLPLGSNVKLSDVPSPPALTNPFAYGQDGRWWCFSGDRNGLYADETGRVVAAWTDNRDTLVETAIAGIPDPNIYFNAVDV